MSRPLSPVKEALAATLTYLGGVLPPHLGYNPGKHVVTHDWLWSVGSHPLSFTCMGTCHSTPANTWSRMTGYGPWAATHCPSHAWVCATPRHAVRMRVSVPWVCAYLPFHTRVSVCMSWLHVCVYVCVRACACHSPPCHACACVCHSPPSVMWCWPHRGYACAWIGGWGGTCLSPQSMWVGGWGRVGGTCLAPPCMWVWVCGGGGVPACHLGVCVVGGGWGRVPAVCGAVLHSHHSRHLVSPIICLLFTPPPFLLICPLLSSS